MNRAATILLLLGATVHGVPAQEPAAPPDIVILAEFVEVSQNDLDSLLAKVEPSEGAVFRDALRGVESSTAETALVRTRSGQRAKAESIREVIYATKFDPPKGRTGGEISGHAGLTGVDVPTPAAFETRNAGTTLEVDPVIDSSGSAVDLNIAVEIVSYGGDVPQSEVPRPDADRPLALTKQPIFHTMKTTTAVHVDEGGTVMAAILTPPGDDTNPEPDRKILLFLRVFLARPE